MKFAWYYLCTYAQIHLGYFLKTTNKQTNNEVSYDYQVVVFLATAHRL